MAKKIAFLGGIFLLFLSSSAQAAIADHVVISEIQTDSTPGSGGESDDFIELYNPTDSVFDLTGYKLKRTTASGGSPKTIQLSGIIPSHGFFLIVRNTADPALQALADLLSANLDITDKNTVWLEDGQGATVDLVGFGTAETYEGAGAAPNPDDGKSIERKSGDVHVADEGNGWDTDDNSADFFVNENPQPQNSASPPEWPTPPPLPPPAEPQSFFDVLRARIFGRFADLKPIVLPKLPDLIKLPKMPYLLILP